MRLFFLPLQRCVTSPATQGLIILCPVPQRGANVTSTPRACLPSGHCQGPVPQGRATKAQLPRRHHQRPCTAGQACEHGQAAGSALETGCAGLPYLWRPGGAAALPLSLSGRTPAQAPPGPAPRFAPQSLPPRGNAERACATAARSRRGRPPRMRDTGFPRSYAGAVSPPGANSRSSL